MRSPKMVYLPNPPASTLHCRCPDAVVLEANRASVIVAASRFTRIDPLLREGTKTDRSIASRAAPRAETIYAFGKIATRDSALDPGASYYDRNTLSRARQIALTSPRTDGFRQFLSLEGSPRR